MFQTEIKVEGKYVSGTIKKNNNTYMLFTNLNIGGDKTHTWTDKQLNEISIEFKQISNKIDELNCPVVRG